MPKMHDVIWPWPVGGCRGKAFDRQFKKHSHFIHIIFTIFLQILSRNVPPYPQIVLPPQGGFWLDGIGGGGPSIGDTRFGPIPNGGIVMMDDVANNNNANANGNGKNGSCARFKLETDETALSYRRHFLGREHHNFYGLDPVVGPLVLSVRVEPIGTQQHFRIILRTQKGTVHQLVAASALADRPSAGRMAKHLCEQITTDRFLPVAFPGGSELILQFDEHVISNTYKFGQLKTARNWPKL
jgi:RAP1 GTPase activating protein 1